MRHRRLEVILRACRIVGLLLVLFQPKVISLAQAGTVSAAAIKPNLSTLAAKFAEPLVATGPTTPGEDDDLTQAIESYTRRSSFEDFKPYEDFLATHPHSAWRLAVLTNLGLSYYHYGYFSKALDAFERAWAEGRSVNRMPAKTLADRAAGELIRMHARLGHAERVAALVDEFRGRNLTGAATELRDGAREGLWLMRHDPGEAYLCGPKALQALLVLHRASPPSLQVAENYRSPGRGTTLAEIGRLADRAGLAHHLIYRPVGTPVPVPSIIHWKVDHFAAIVGERDGRYQLSDPTFGDSQWVTRRAIDSEGSGYFLVPAGVAGQGWRDVRADEAGSVRGMGTTKMSDPAETRICSLNAQSSGCGAASQSLPGSVTAGNGLTNDPGPSGAGTAHKGMAGYQFKEMLVSLNISDTPVGYVPPKGPSVRVMVVYNQREASQPATFSFFNVSQKWTLNWLAYVQDDPTMPAGSSVTRMSAGGGYVSEIGYNTSTASFTPEVDDYSVLSIVSTNPLIYQRTMADGSVEQYSLSNGATTNPRLIFLTKVTDPAGNAVTLNYDSEFRLHTIKDATGRLTTFAYKSGVSDLLVTQITDPFGRSAQLGYDGSGRLSQITDVYGITSRFGYDASSLVDSLTTPYGTTQFSYGMGTDGISRYLQATDPLGHTERLEYVQAAPGVPYSDPAATVPSGIVSPFNEYLNARDTFYWDKHAYAVGAGDYTKARNRHWTHLTVNGAPQPITAGTLESIKFPLESRIWYSYPGQQGTEVGSAQSGTLNQPIDVGRVLDDGSTQLLRMTYNGLGNISSRADPAGRQTAFEYYPNNIDVQAVQQNTGSGAATIAQFTYNGQHLPLTYIDAAGKTTRYTYNSAGQLRAIVDALGEKTTYNYNSTGDLTSTVNADGKTALSYTYDGDDRVQTATDSEGWTVQFAYDALDRVTKETFPDGTTRVFAYSNLDLQSVTDRQGRTTMYGYNAVRDLTSITDPLMQVTRLGRYENGTLASLTDPNGHTTSWSIDLESRVLSKQYADGTQTGYAYEGTTSRLHFISDALNQITQFSYTLDNRVSGVQYINSRNPTPNVAFAYDSYFPFLVSMTDGSGTTTWQYKPVGKPGALQQAQETPPVANAAIAYGYDALGRVSTRSVGGNVENFAYDTIGRLVSHADDLGTFKRGYLGETNQIMSQSNGTVGTSWSYDSNASDRRLTGIVNSGQGSSYSYATTPEYDISGISDLSQSTTTTYGYDLADRLKTAAPSAGSGYSYQYDGAGNITTIQRPGGTTGITPNSVNQVLSENGTAFAYDANGNLLRDYARTYRWDAENRLIAIGYLGQQGKQTGFQYDGLGRRIAISAASGGVTGTTLYRWCGETLCQAQGIGGVSKRYFAEGEENLSTVNSYYYGVDQLGSVRDALYTNGQKAGHTDYEPYGFPITNTATQTDFRYAGLFYEQQSGLYLANYRVYDSLVGKWLSRDPIGETSDQNLYRYVVDNSIVSNDPSGFCGQSPQSNQLSCPAGVQMVSVSGSVKIPLLSKILPKWASLSVGFGVAIDPAGNIAVPVFGYAGGGKGASESLTANYTTSNAKNFSDFGGPFAEGGGMAGLGLGGGMAKFAGQGGVTGTTYSAGEVIGASASGGASYTDIGPTMQTGLCKPR